MAYTQTQLSTFFTNAQTGVAPNSAQSLTLQAIATQNATGQLTDAQALQQTINLAANSTTDVSVGAYEFFLGFAPSVAGLTALNAAYTGTGAQAGLNGENRFIAESVALATQNATAKAAFAASYGTLTVAQATAAAYNIIIGNPAATAAGVDVAAAVAYLSSAASQAYYTGFIKANVPGLSAADLDLAVKAAIVGEIMYIADGYNNGAGLGAYATATNALVADLADDGKLTADNAAGIDLFTAYPTAVAGTSFTLTTAANTFAGGAGADTIDGGLVSNTTPASNTLNLTDVITGGAGSDTLNITTEDTVGDATGGATISGVETINIRAIAGSAATLNASTTAGVTTVNAYQGAGTVTVTNLAAGAAIGVVGNGVVINGATTYGYATATSAQTINISGGTAGGNITSSNGTATSVTINSTGADNTVGTIDPVTGTQVTTLTINAATGLTAALNAAYAATSTLKITGAGAVTLTGMSTAAFKTIDASASTGAVNLGDIGTVATTYTGSAGKDTVTLNSALTTAAFGAGDDVVTTGTVGTTTAGAIDGGTGTDTLAVAAAADVNSAAKRAVFTGFETLQNNTAAAIAVDGFAGITALKVGADGGGFTGLTAAQAVAVTNTVDNTAVTFALTTATGTADVLTINAQNATKTASADLAGLTITGFETLNVAAASGNVDETNAAATIVSFAGGGAADLTAINVSGAFAANLILDNTAKAVTVTSTQSGTAALRVEGEVIKGSVINGTANGDTFETALANVLGVAGEFVTYNLGAGDDAISTSLTGLNNVNAGLASIKIDGGAGTDTLSFQTTDVTFVDAQFQYITNVEKLAFTNTANLSVTSGGFFDTNFKGAGVTLTAASIANGSTATINLASFTGAAKVALTTAADGATTADNVTITTGSGADDVTVTAASWVSAATAANGTLSVTTGAGNDKISVTTGALLAGTGAAGVSINGGLGADAITVSHTNSATVAIGGNATFVIADGDSLVSSFDTITGFNLSTVGTQADTLDLAGTPTIVANGAVNGTDSGTILSHSVTGGIITFDDADTFAGAVVVNSTNLANVTAYLAANITTPGATVAFAYDSDGNGTADATFVFQQGASDTLVELVGVVGTSVSLTNSVATAGVIHIG